MKTFEINLREFLLLTKDHEGLLKNFASVEKATKNDIVVCSYNKFADAANLGKVLYAGTAQKLRGKAKEEDGDTGEVCVAPYNKARLPKSADAGMFTRVRKCFYT